MRIPGATEAVISTQKIVGYLLNPDHPDGGPKARVLGHAGFRVSHPEELKRALREQHLVGDAREGRFSPFGKKYEITGPLAGPTGHVAATSVWMIRHGETVPRLITIVPEALE
jgi:filamentous hemagglutinin